MSEANQGQRLLISMILLLLAVVFVQAWYMVRMEHQLGNSNTDDISTNIVANAATAQTDGSVENLTTDIPAYRQSPSPTQDNQAVDNSQHTHESDNSTDNPFSLSDDFLNPPFNAKSWDPYEDFRRMQQHMDSVFNERHNRISKRPDYEYRFSQKLSTPRIKVRQDNTKYLVQVNIPGTDENNISVNLEGQRLTIRARQGYEKKDSDPSGHIIFRERRSGRYQRSIMLREPVDQKGMKTRVENGVLTVMIPKARW